MFSIYLTVILLKKLTLYQSRVARSGGGTPAGTARAENPFFVPPSEAQKISWSRARGKLPRNVAERIRLKSIYKNFVIPNLW